MTYIIYNDLECVIKKIDGYENNPQKSSTRKIGQHIPCGYSMSTIWRFDHIEDKTYFIPQKRLYEKFL